MSIKLEQIEHSFHKLGRHSAKWAKNQRNRKIRRAKKDKIPHIKYKGWEY